MEVSGLPSVDALVRHLYDGATPNLLLARIARSAVEEARSAMEADRRLKVAESLAAGLLEDLRLSRLVRVVNASGVLLHTNLGRASWSEAAVVAAELASGFGNVELDLRSGDRGGRGAYVAELLVALTGAEAALVVNNNAGGVFLTLSVLASEGSVPVSRGELIEIGGSYRLPELMGASGVRLVEVGTTNRTRLSDYGRAVDESTGLLLKVHPSNFVVSGFTEEASLADLAALAGKVAVPLVFDAGSGLLDASTPWLAEHPPPWLSGEPGIRQALAAGADLVLFSGDKLLGGPQAGIIVGRGDLVERLAASPVARALRVDGVTLAALAATLEAYADRRVLEIPFWRMATTSHEELAARSEAVVEASGVDCVIVEGVSVVGGGSVPGKEIPGPVIEMAGSADHVFSGLLGHDPPVLARRLRGRLLVDLRAVDPSDDVVVAGAMARVCR